MTESGTPTAGDLVGTYAELPFPPAREVGIDTVRIGLARHHIPVLAEVDVTRAEGLADRALLPEACREEYLV